MHGTGYLDTRRRHPALLASAIALHVGIVGVILSYHPEILPGQPTALNLSPITMDPPPPPRPETDTRAKTKPEPRQQIDRTTTVLPLDPPTPNWPETPPLPPGPLKGEGIGGGTSTVLPPPESVITPVGMDRRYAGDLQPPYPPALQRAEIAGNVTVRVQIGPDGRVIAVEMVRTDHPDFFASTRDWALKRWRFRPATRDGVPVAAWTTKTVRFELAR